MKTIISSLSIIILGITMVLFTGCSSTSPSTAGNQYSSPDWAPAYEPGVRYYYLPDIETYYDVRDRSFIYLNQGQWISSRDLPLMYRDYDLYNGYEVMLDRRVYEPWRYHQNYVSSYPRYYYRSMYGNQNQGRVRGYNENDRKPVYSSPSVRTRRNETVNSSSPEVNTGTTPANRSSDYSNRRVGKPVKVTPEMKQPKQENPSGISSRRQSTSTGRGTGTGTSNGEVQQQRRSTTTTTPPPSVRRNKNRQQQDSITGSKRNMEERRQNQRR